MKSLIDSMIVSANNITSNMGKNIFVNDYKIEPVIEKELYEIRSFLILNIYDYDTFHSHINKIYVTWFQILKPEFKNLIDKYNRNYINYQVYKEETQRKMINMASDFAASDLDRDLSDLFVSPNNISSLTSAISKTRISSKKRALKK